MMADLANLTGIEVYEALTVNSVTEFASLCTSVIAHDKNGQIIHGRNLDFGNQDLMSHLVYVAEFYDGEKYLFDAPSIAGFFGVYTGIKKGKFSLSFNVREIDQGFDGVFKNL